MSYAVGWGYDQQGCDNNVDQLTVSVNKHVLQIALNQSYLSSFSLLYSVALIGDYDDATSLRLIKGYCKRQLKEYLYAEDENNHRILYILCSTRAMSDIPSVEDIRLNCHFEVQIELVTNQYDIFNDNTMMLSTGIANYIYLQLIHARHNKDSGDEWTSFAVEDQEEGVLINKVNGYVATLRNVTLNMESLTGFLAIESSVYKLRGAVELTTKEPVYFIPTNSTVYITRVVDNYLSKSDELNRKLGYGLYLPMDDDESRKYYLRIYGIQLISDTASNKISLVEVKDERGRIFVVPVCLLTTSSTEMTLQANKNKDIIRDSFVDAIRGNCKNLIEKISVLQGSSATRRCDNIGNSNSGSTSTNKVPKFQTARSLKDETKHKSNEDNQPTTKRPERVKDMQRVAMKKSKAIQSTATQAQCTTSFGVTSNQQNDQTPVQTTALENTSTNDDDGDLFLDSLFTESAHAFSPPAIVATGAKSTTTSKTCNSTSTKTAGTGVKKGSSRPSKEK